jgi:hypothetical protein
MASQFLALLPDKKQLDTNHPRFRDGWNECLEKISGRITLWRVETEDYSETLSAAYKVISISGNGFR